MGVRAGNGRPAFRKVCETKAPADGPAFSGTE